MTEVLQQVFRIDYPTNLKMDPLLVSAQPESYYVDNPNSDHHFINIITAPKSGTHLLTGILHLLKVSFQMKANNRSPAPHLRHYYDFNPEVFNNKTRLKKAFNAREKYLITARNPKDVLISYIQWVDERMKRGLIPYEESWDSFSIEDKLEQILKGEPFIELESLKESLWYISNYVVAAKIKTLKLKNILFLKFEDMIGPELGGSSIEVQRKTFKKLCKFTEASCTDNKINQLIQSLPLTRESSNTFIDQKKVGKWEDHFSDKIMTLYNKQLRQVEKQLGYNS